MRIDVNSWYYSPDHGQLCQVIEIQTLWGDTTCRVWLSGSDSVVRILAANLKPLEDAATSTPVGITYVAAAARVADAFTHCLRAVTHRRRPACAYRILGYPSSSSDQGAVPGDRGRSVFARRAMPDRPDTLSLSRRGWAENYITSATDTVRSPSIFT